MCCNWFDISIAVRTFVGLHTNRKTRFTLVHEKFHSRWPHEVNAFLSNDTETLKSGEFLFSSVLVAPCVYEVRRWEKEAVGRIKCRRFSQNGEGEKKNEFYAVIFYARCIAHSIPSRRSTKKKYIYNNSMFIQYKI